MFPAGRGAPLTQEETATLAECEVFPGDEIKVVRARSVGGFLLVRLAGGVLWLPCDMPVGAINECVWW